MKVIEHLTQVYFMLENNGDYYLDVNCNQGLCEFSVFLQLNESELTRYKERGTVELEALAVSIINAPDAMNDRKINDRVLLDKAYLAIVKHA